MDSNKDFEKCQEELLAIAQYLCDGNQKESQELFDKTKVLSLKYKPFGEPNLWFKTIMKFLYLDKIKSASAHAD